jgi:transcriptional regulator with XRE-family HTH domain
MSDQDEAIGARVQGYRKKWGLSQDDLANAMRERGWKWAQATVWNVENGERPLRFSEVIGLAELFHMPLQAFLPDADDKDFKDPRVANIEYVQELLATKLREIVG